MRHSPLLLLLLLGLTLPLAAQDSEFDQALDGLRNAQKKAITGDLSHFVKILAERWEQADDSQKGKAVGLAGGNLRAIDEGVLNETLRALAVMKGGKRDAHAAASTKAVIAFTKQKRVEDNPTLFIEALSTIGQIGHDSGLKALTKLLNHKEYQIVGGAIAAMGHYQEAEFKTRKTAVEDILKTYTSVANNANKDPSDQTLKRRLDLVQGPSEATLKALTGETSVQGSDAWWSWWNNTGKRTKDWGGPKKEG